MSQTQLVHILRIIPTYILHMPTKSMFLRNLLINWCSLNTIKCSPEIFHEHLIGFANKFLSYSSSFMSSVLSRERHTHTHTHTHRVMVEFCYAKACRLNQSANSTPSGIWWANLFLVACSKSNHKHRYSFM